MLLENRAVLFIPLMAMLMMDNVHHSSAQDNPRPYGIKFIGVGYNIIDGNPEGGRGSGGVDPGLLSTRPILKLSYDGVQTSSAEERIPNEVYFFRRHSVLTTSSHDTYYGTASYASKLSTQVDVTGSYGGPILDFQFAGSTRYGEIRRATRDNGIVYYNTETKSLFGEARYLTETAEANGVGLDETFVAAACSLPSTWNRDMYMDFISTWGTVGASVSLSGQYGAYSGSISVNMDSFNENMESGSRFGSRETIYMVGSDTLNDPQVIVPLAWPNGTYGLPKPTSGCPNSQFPWAEGQRKHDTEDRNPSNEWSNTIHLDGLQERSSMEHKFCIKNVVSVDPDVRNQWTWQPGSYCIYKFRDCPTDFTAGHIYWDDEDNSNGNSYSGTMPDGVFGRNTKMEFCCRDDGVPSRPTYLPTDDNFMLFSHIDHCQQVHGMRVSKEWFRWDNESTNNDDYQSADHPYEGVEGTGNQILLNFCYYQRI